MLTFDKASHTYRWNGQPVVNVTRVLELVTDFSRVDPDVLAAACERGQAVHEVCEYHDKGTLDEDSVHPLIAPYLAGYRKFLAECRPRWEGIEERVYHRAHGFAGTLDRRGWMFNAPAMLDIKSGIEHPAVRLQVSAYADAKASEPDFLREKWRRFALYLRDTGTYSLVDLDKDTHHHTDLRDFLCTLGTYRWKQRNNLITPNRELAALALAA